MLAPSSSIGTSPTPPSAATVSNSELVRRFTKNLVETRFLLNRLVETEDSASRPPLPQELIEHIASYTLPNSFDGTFGSLFHSNHSLEALTALLASMHINIDDEMKAIDEMSKIANSCRSRISVPEKYTYFSHQYGRTYLENILSFIEEFKCLPSAVKNDTTIEKRFLTRGFVNVWNETQKKIQDPSKNITELDLSYEGLHRLPRNIRNLTALTKLNLFENQLTMLPGWIGELKALKELNLCNNPIAKNPKAIKALQASLPHTIIKVL